MIRIPYMAELVNFLANNAAIIAAKLNDSILLFAQWDIEKITNNWGDAIIIVPGRGDVTSNTERRTNCHANVSHEVSIGIQVRNPSSTVQHFVIDSTTPLAVTGAYSDAAALEAILRQAILDFNASLAATNNNKYTPLTLIELQESEQSNGFLILRQLYKTTFIF